ncbi:MAG: cell division protein FtsZ [Hyphomicrobiales bacterium]
MTINLKLPHVTELKPRITVFGTGGAGGNAVNNMIECGLEGVEFVVANTDAQALAQSSAERRIQMGAALTEGLGAGSQPQIGAAAAEEALPEIIDHLSGAHMVFITAGMGGGTGTGAAPVIARASKEQGILTVGVVTKPFHFEGQRRMETADRGIDMLAQHVDTLIVIPNQNLFRVANEKTTFADAFAMADQVLFSGVAGITDLMIKEGLINLDFADVRAVMSEMGKAMMGTGEGSGEKRAVESAEAAISNPLLDDVSMRGARGLLISITGGSDLTLYEVDEAATRIREEVDPEANIILGATFDDSLEGVMRVSVVATGIANETIGEHPVYQHNTASTSYYASETEQNDYQDAPAEAAYAVTAPASDPVAEEPVPAPVFEPEIEAQIAQETEVSIERAPAAEIYEEPVHSQPVQTQPVHTQPLETPVDNASQQYTQTSVAETRPPVTRMPEVEDFPPIAQRAIAAKKGLVVDDLASHAQTRRKGFLERLATVGLGRKEPVAIPVDPVEPTLNHQFGAEEPAAPRAAEGQPQAIATTTRQADNRIDPAIDDEQLEIPAFLRRQAN